MRPILGAALLVLLAACAAPGHSPGTAPLYPDEIAGPLRAEIIDTHGDIRVWTNRPAYVAVFEIIPGRGAGLLYPAYSDERSFVRGGSERLWISRTRPFYDYLGTASVRGSGIHDMPRYLYLIASDEPLRIGRYIASPGSLRGELGMHVFASMNPYQVMNAIPDRVLGRVGDSGWAEHTVAIWPRVRAPRQSHAMADWVQVVCADGRVVQGPWYYAYGACGALENRPPPRAGDPPAGGGDDSTRVRPPRRTRPEPVARGGDDASGIVPPVRIERIQEPRPERDRSRPSGRGAPGRASAGEAERGSGSPEGAREAPARPRMDSPEPRVERPAPRVERPVPRPEPANERPEPPAPRPDPPVQRADPVTPRQDPPARVERPEPPAVRSDA